MHLGDFNFGDTVHHKFTTVNSSGVPTGFSSGGLTVYGASATDPSATGITLTSTFNAVTGLSHVKIAMSTTGFYSSAGEFQVVVSSGAASEDLTGYVICEFSVGRKTAVLVSTAVAISTGSAIDSVTSVNSTVDANVAQWRGAAPSTLDTNDHVRVSTAQALNISTANSIDAVTSVNSTVDANVRLWLGTAPTTLGTNSFLAISTTSAILSASTVGPVVVSTAVAISTGSAIDSVTSVNSTVDANVRLWRSAAPSTLGPNSHVRVSTTTQISTAQNIARAVSVSSAIVSSAVTISTASNIDTVGNLSASGLDLVVLSEPSTGPPAAAPTLPVAVSWAHYTLRHQVRVNSTGKIFYDSSGNALWAKGLQGDSATYLELLGATAT